MAAYVCCMHGMFSRLRYLHMEGFEICAILGADNFIELDSVGEAAILYRLQDPSGQWRMATESFRVTHREMIACSAFFVHRVLRQSS